MRTRSLLLTALVGAFILLFPNPALADSGRHCTALGSCIEVWGDGVHVDKIHTSVEGCRLTGGVQDHYFRTHVWGYLPDGTKWERYGDRKYINWGAFCNDNIAMSTWYPDRNFNNDSNMCSSLDWLDGSTWKKWDVACVNIHS